MFLNFFHRTDAGGREVPGILFFGPRLADKAKTSPYLKSNALVGIIYHLNTKRPLNGIF